MKYSEIIKQITTYGFNRYLMGVYDERGDYIKSDECKMISDSAFDKVIEELEKIIFDK